MHVRFENRNPTEPAGPCVWAVGGGKGGVGKSVVASSLAIALAQRGERCVLVDCDLGGANLHTLLGGAAPRLSLGDFLSRRVATLSEVMSSTRFPARSLGTGKRARRSCK